MDKSERLKKGNRIKLSFETLIKVDRYLWFTSDYHNGLFRVGLPEDRIDKDEMGSYAEFMGRFPNEIKTKRLWSYIEKKEDKLFFVPYSADNVTIYDMATGEFTAIELKKDRPLHFKTVDYCDDAKFSFCKWYGDKLVFYPYSYPAIVVLDADKLELDHLYGPIQFLSGYIGRNTPYFWRETIGAKGMESDLLWSQAAKAFLRYTFKDNEIQIVKKLDLEGAYFDVVFDGKAYWMIPLHGRYKLLKVSSDLESIQGWSFPSTYTLGDRAFSDAQFIGREIWLLPKVADRTIRIHVDTGEISEVHELSDLAGTGTEDLWNFRIVKRIDNILLGFSVLKYRMVLFDLDRNKAFSMPVILDRYRKDRSSDMRTFFLEFSEDRGRCIYQESEILSLPVFLDRIKDSSSLENGTGYEGRGGYGTKIYRYISQCDRASL